MASISAPDLDRNQRIKAILDEVKREKPLVDNLYGSSAMDEIEKPSTVVKTVPPKKLQRSQSAASITSNAPSTHTIEHNPGSNLPHQNPRKDAIRLNMLSNIAVAKNQAIKMKTHPKNPTLQIEVPLSQRSHKIGAIPKYLTDRKEEWARIEKERIENLPDPDCPPGHVLMPESEKLETLNQLYKSQQELMEEYTRFPLSRDSLRIRQKKKEIEEQLNKVEEGIRVLSKPKVFVKLES